MDTGTQATDALLVQATMPSGADAQLPGLLLRLRSALPDSSVQVHAALNKAQDVFNARLYLPGRAQLDPLVAAAPGSALISEWPQLQNLRVSRLEKVYEEAGASAGTKGVFHYVVEMDPQQAGCRSSPGGTTPSTCRA